ncbi:MAG: hypothetical protein WD229_18700 [Pirellulales bacterium]
MLYLKAPGFCIREDFIAAGWGEFVRYLEVGDDQHAVRQVEIFDNGNVLRYDRSHWCDDFGLLLGLRFSRKPKWSKTFPGAEIIAAAEFERVWRAARRSPLWEQQVAHSRAAQWGTWEAQHEPQPGDVNPCDES